MTRQEAARRLRAIQMEHGDLFTPELAQRVGQRWNKIVAAMEKFGITDYAYAMKEVERMVHEFVYGDETKVY